MKQQQYQVNDKVRHNLLNVLGTVTEVSIGAKGYMYRVRWKGSPPKDFTWHSSDELASETAPIVKAF